MFQRFEIICREQLKEIDQNENMTPLKLSWFLYNMIVNYQKKSSYTLQFSIFLAFPSRLA